MNKKKSYTTKRDIISGAYFLLPLTVSGLHWGFGVIDGSWFRLIFPMLAGCWGLAMRGIFLRKHEDDPFPYYISLYPLAIIMHGLLIYTVLSLFKPFEGCLFFTAALALGMFFGFYAHPSGWPISWIFKAVLKRMIELGDKASKS
jgi:hypothetical protein